MSVFAPPTPGKVVTVYGPVSVVVCFSRHVSWTYSTGAAGQTLVRALRRELAPKVSVGDDVGLRHVAG